ncbi:14626_t:CDS:1, partial [Racocetra persica]
AAVLRLDQTMVVLDLSIIGWLVYTLLPLDNIVKFYINKIHGYFW